jgi:nitroimidazol reductase NimA-like FMN-containing flavoprotein (pyridoxamine 5'-phosphate oxidase superfamily)
MAADADITASAAPTAAVVLDRQECLELLDASRFGRLAVSIPDKPPVIRPVHYVFDRASQSVVIRSARGSKLGALLRSQQAAFEIDGIDETGTTGWSVIITGGTEEITSRTEIERLLASGLEFWAPGRLHRLVRIRAFTVTGRRIARG